MIEGKKIKIFGVRSGLIGDMITALPILDILEQKHPDSYKIWFIQKKCSQAAPLFIQHPLIDKIIISTADEEMTKEEIKLKESCDISVNVSPPVIDDGFWYNIRNHVDESILMAGFKPKECLNKIPSLTKWFSVEKKIGTVAIWAFSGYGNSPQRNPTKEWWNKTCEIFIKMGLKIVQFGHDYDPLIHKSAKRFKKTSFFDQIKFSLSCDFVIGTDSGSQWVLGAYGMPQIILFTNWLTNHWSNLESLCPINSNGLQIRLFAPSNCDNIPHQNVEIATTLLTHKCQIEI